MIDPGPPNVPELVPPRDLPSAKIMPLGARTSTRASRDPQPAMVGTSPQKECMFWATHGALHPSRRRPTPRRSYGMVTDSDPDGIDRLALAFCYILAIAMFVIGPVGHLLGWYR